MANINPSVPKILFVEDEAELLELYALSLKRQPYQILKALGGKAAIEILTHETPHVVVLDLAMPDINGIDVLRFLRNQPHLSHTRVVILTAVPILLEEEENLVMDLVLFKPITPSRLENTIAALMKEVLSDKA